LTAATAKFLLFLRDVLGHNLVQCTYLSFHDRLARGTDYLLVKAV